MMEIDLNQIFNTLIAGGAIYTGIHIHIKFIWRDIDKIDERVTKLEDS